MRFSASLRSTLLEVALERRDLLGDEVLGAGVGVELICRREQEALERVGAAGAVLAGVEALRRLRRRLLVVALEARVLGERRDLVERVALGDRDDDLARPRLLRERVDRRAVAHVLGERVVAGDDVVALAGERHPDPKEAGVVDHALLLEDVGDLVRGRPLGDLDHDLALPVARERLEEGEPEPDDRRRDREDDRGRVSAGATARRPSGRARRHAGGAGGGWPAWRLVALGRRLRGLVVLDGGFAASYGSARGSAGGGGVGRRRGCRLGRAAVAVGLRHAAAERLAPALLALGAALLALAAALLALARRGVVDRERVDLVLVAGQRVVGVADARIGHSGAPSGRRARRERLAR